MSAFRGWRLGLYGFGAAAHIVCQVARHEGRTPPAAGIARIGVAFVDTDVGREALAAAIALAGLTGASVNSYTVLEPPEYTGAYAVPGWIAPPSETLEPLGECAQEAAHAALAALAALPEGIHGTAKVPWPSGG